MKVMLLFRSFFKYQPNMTIEWMILLPIYTCFHLESTFRLLCWINWDNSNLMILWYIVHMWLKTFGSTLDMASNCVGFFFYLVAISLTCIPYFLSCILYILLYICVGLWNAMVLLTSIISLKCDDFTLKCVFALERDGGIVTL